DSGEPARRRPYHVCAVRTPRPLASAGVHAGGVSLHGRDAVALPHAARLAADGLPRVADWHGSSADARRLGAARLAAYRHRGAIVVDSGVLFRAEFGSVVRLGP